MMEFILGLLGFVVICLAILFYSMADTYLMFSVKTKYEGYEPGDRLLGGEDMEIVKKLDTVYYGGEFSDIVDYCVYLIRIKT